MKTENIERREIYIYPKKLMPKRNNENQHKIWK